MRIVDLICSLALLTLAANSAPSPATVDPNNDFDCAVVFDFLHRMAQAKQAPAELLEETSVMYSWFIAKWMEHPGESAGRREHYVAMVKAMGDERYWLTGARLHREGRSVIFGEFFRKAEAATRGAAWRLLRRGRSAGELAPIYRP